MKCLAVDDEPIALEGMVSYIDQTPFLTLAGQCRDAFEAMTQISKGDIDLVFLDINMPDLTGTDMIGSLNNPPLIVFTTAYPDYALKGFELSAVDYLLKPIAYDKFLKASQKALDLHNLMNQSAVSQQEDTIFIKVDKKIIRVRVGDILYIESLKDYVRVHTKTAKYIAYLSLNKLSASLPEQSFVQVHKSFIVSTTAIDAIDHDVIEIGRSIIPIGRTYKTQLFEKVIDKTFLKK